MYVGILIQIAIFAFIFLGYVSNIVHIVHYHSVVDFMLILRCVGIAVAPLGAVLGFF